MGLADAASEGKDKRISLSRALMPADWNSLHWNKKILTCESKDVPGNWQYFDQLPIGLLLLQIL